MPEISNDLFAWQGFRFPHPPDFAPATLTGNRREGYARLGSSGRLGIQIRWKESSKPSNLKKVLDPYIDRLARDAKKAKSAFKSDLEREEGGIVYRYTGGGQGRGFLFFHEESKRVFFIEVVGSRKDQLLPLFRQIRSGFEVSARKAAETWSLFGLRFTSPIPLIVEKQVFQVGRTQLLLKAPGLRLEANRWGFGQQLVEKHTLEAWAKAAMAMRHDPSTIDESRVEFKPKGLIRPVSGLAYFDAEANQITTLKGLTRNPAKRPSFEWLSI